MPNTPGLFGPIDRRTSMRGAGGLVGLGALAVIAGCADETMHDPDPLASLEAAARADADAATKALALGGARQAALRTIAQERTAHADALHTEIARVIGVYRDGSTPVHKTRPPTTNPLPDQPITIATLRTRLAAARRAAADLAPRQSGYRAGLLASISAACAVHDEVLLA